MDQVRLHFDPLCPWCYQTSRWARRLEELGEIDLDWGVFSLEIVNAKDDIDPATMETRAGPALRTAIVLRDKVDRKAVGRFYGALGHRMWEEPPPPDDMAEGARAALGEIGLDPALVDTALDDPGTWDAVIEEHGALVERTGTFGVPTIVLDGEGGPAIFGPVVSELPSDADAVELWRHTAWLVRYRNFAELKRARPQPPDLPTVAWHREQRAASGR